MRSSRPTPRTTLLVAAAAAASAIACSNKDLVTLPRTAVNTTLFKSYVALGNSITAGFQSGGIIDTTQAESYAALIAHQAGTRYAYPGLAFPGCPPPVVNFQTGARLAGGTATTCGLRDTASITSALNNVAVPGAASIDPFSPSTANSNPLTTFILGGKTQVQRALDAQPTFVSVWIGNNDVLPAALRGVVVPVPNVSPGVTPVDSFTAHYGTMLTALTRARPGLKGILIGVIDVTAIPAFFPVQDLISDPAYKGEFDAAAGTTTIVAPDCNNSGALVSLEIVAAIRSGQYSPPIIDCATQSPLTLDTVKQGLIAGTVGAYNAYISAQATSLGFAYIDLNPVLLQFKTAGLVTARPDFLSATSPFGPLFSLDGVHPNAAAHQYIANAIIRAIDAKYSVAIDTLLH